MKTIKNLFMAILLGLTTIVNAQENRIEFTFGSAKPLGDFASTDYDKENSSYAMSGINFSLSYEKRHPSQFGTKILINSQFHEMNADELLAQFINDNRFSNNYNVETGNFKTFNIMAGFTGTLPFSESKLSLTGQILVGVAIVHSPYVKHSYVSDQSFYIIREQKSASAAGMAALIGGSLNYNLTERIGMNLGTDLYATSVHLKNVKEKTTTPRGSGTKDVAFEQTVISLNTNIGLYFKF